MRLYRFILILLLFTFWNAAPSYATTDLSTAEPLFVGAYINGTEQEPINIVRQEDTFWISTEDWASLLGIKIQITTPPFSINTPIGQRTLSPEALSDHENITYISHETLAKLVRIDLKFINSLYAISLDVPWTPGATLALKSTPNKQQVDNVISPPDSSLSFIRFETFTTHQFNDQDDDIFNTLDAGGRIASGTWALQFSQEYPDADPPIKINRYYWDKYTDQHAFRLGSNYIRLSPLLHNYDFTGAQWAYSNQGVSQYTDFSRAFSQDSFLADDQLQQRTINQQNGPPAGIAELRINNIPVARVRIGLDGRYEFRNIPETVGGFSVTEIYLYERHLQQEPLEIIDYTRTLVSGMLAAGEILMRSGVGASGNAFYSSESQSSDTVSFLQTRYGVTDKWTLEGSLQRSLDGDNELLLTNQLSFNSHWAGALSLASRNNRFGAQAEITGLGENWQFRLRGLHHADAYQQADKGSFNDYNLRTFYRLNKSFNVGLVGHYLRDEAQEDINFLLPSVDWRPNHKFFASATPNFDGNYRLHADYRMTPYLQFISEFEGEVYTQQLDYYINDDALLSIAHEYNQQDQNYSSYALLDWRPKSNQHELLQAGLSLNNGDSTGFMLSWQRIFTPGLELRLEYHNQYRLFGENKDNHFLFANLIVDFAHVGKRFIPADNRYVNSTRGGIVGAIKQPNGQSIPVDDITFKINGRQLNQQQAGGYFHINQLKSGTYQVSIDESNLPIEYSAKHHHYNVEVASSAFTEVNFEVIAEYGIAGKVTSDDDQAIVSAKVILTSEDGLSSYESTTNAFGFYRIDQIPPGNYILIASQNSGKTTPTRQIKITNDYLFGQDLSF